MLKKIVPINILMHSIQWLFIIRNSRKTDTAAVFLKYLELKELVPRLRIFSDNPDTLDGSFFKLQKWNISSRMCNTYGYKAQEV